MLVRVIEDHPDIAELLEQTLPRFDIDVLVTSTNFEGLLAESAWDGVEVAIVDFNLGDVTGDVILRWLQKHRPDVRRILFSAVAGVSQVAADGLADIVLRKPADVEAIVRAIRG